jgi:16S rRNA (uracil1498-N3)-methyltransferase
MPRFFVEQGLELGRYILRGDDFHHIRDVLRLKPGEAVVLCDGAGHDFAGRIVAYAPESVELDLLECSASLTEPPYHAVLYQGLAKGDKMESIIQKAVEFGVSRIVPVQCRRSVVRLTPGDVAGKTARWNRVALAAAKQCGRGQVPLVAAPLDFATAAAEAAQASVALMPWEGERQTSLRAVLEAADCELAAPSPSISILIGPEGGFAAEEVALAAGLGIRTVSLGPRILRTETAGAAVLAMLLYRMDCR